MSQKTIRLHLSQVTSADCKRSGKLTHAWQKGMFLKVKIREVLGVEDPVHLTTGGLQHRHYNPTAISESL